MGPSWRSGEDGSGDGSDNGGTNGGSPSAPAVTVAEAAVVGIEHEIKGQAIYAFVILKETSKNHNELIAEMIDTVSSEIGKIAKPETIQITRDLPKTRSGKIMRRILRKIANDDVENLGDTTTLADPSIVEDLIKNKQH